MKRSQLLMPWPRNAICDVVKAQAVCNLFASLSASRSEVLAKPERSFRRSKASLSRRARALALEAIARHHRALLDGEEDGGDADG